MRSELITQAVVPVRNLFLLVHVASVITRKFHRPTKDRVQDSINNALAGIGEGKYLLSPGVVLSNIQPDGIDAAPMWAIRAGAVDMGTLTGFTSLATGLPYFAPDEDETTAEERMAVCSALLNVADEVVETA